MTTLFFGSYCLDIFIYSMVLAFILIIMSFEICLVVYIFQSIDLI
ncbi:hypothetical protein PAUR_b1205 [Pseudoalteromonas aurantia 208]|uniref:NADH dehydrogenase subunit 4L n=1 Tax=Pseudoalteromonas aurantia 208 TaxID=1314867 RepID=A0ABR9EMV6_9GAMM|nr:hypothetical protein [Pseudoalteromonas aurantia 208]